MHMLASDEASACRDAGVWQEYGRFPSGTRAASKRFGNENTHCAIRASPCPVCVWRAHQDERTWDPGVDVRSRLLKRTNVCGEDQPAAAQMSWRAKPTEKALKATIFRVECGLTPIGDGRPEDSQCQ